MIAMASQANSSGCRWSSAGIVAASVGCTDEIGEDVAFETNGAVVWMSRSSASCGRGQDLIVPDRRASRSRWTCPRPCPRRRCRSPHPVAQGGGGGILFDDQVRSASDRTAHPDTHLQAWIGPAVGAVEGQNNSACTPKARPCHQSSSSSDASAAACHRRRSGTRRRPTGCGGFWLLAVRQILHPEFAEPLAAFLDLTMRCSAVRTAVLSIAMTRAWGTVLGVGLELHPLLEVDEDSISSGLYQRAGW